MKFPDSHYWSRIGVMYFSKEFHLRLRTYRTNHTIIIL